MYNILDMNTNISADGVISINEVDAYFEQKVEREKQKIFSKIVNDTNTKLGLNNPKAGQMTARYGDNSDILPFTAIKKYVKLLKNRHCMDTYKKFTTEYWDEQLAEAEKLARENVAATVSESTETTKSPGLVV